jgi:hypothetical protein
MKISALAALLSLNLLTNSAFAETVKPKYGPQATPLTNSHEYLEKNKAPDYWALSPYYVSQIDDSACSVASVSAVVNAARAALGLSKKLTSDDELATQKGLLARVKTPDWNGGLWGKLTSVTHGVPLDHLGKIVQDSLAAYGVAGATVTTVHVKDTSQQSLKELEQVLLENEKSAYDFIILNFNQAIYTGDAEVGHISPLGAYDAANHRALVMDVDRQWYEPYWVSSETLLAGMATRDKSASQNRGYIWVKLAKTQ